MPSGQFNAFIADALHARAQQSRMLGWLIGGLILSVGGVIITLIWWRMGDQWADEKYKRLPKRKPGAPAGPDAPRVIRRPPARHDSPN